MSDLDRVWDAVVVGSGITGGWAAKELTERGLQVLLVERGRHIEPGRDYGDQDVPRFGMFPKPADAERDREEYPVQSRAPGFNDATRPFFVRDAEHPYGVHPGTEWAWIRGYQLGGRSLTWGYQVYRWCDLDFEANAKDGHGVDWPIRYRDIEPWYDHVERFMGVSGSVEGLPQIPDGPFLSPMEMTPLEAFAKRRIEAAYPDRRLIMGRVAVLTRDHEGRRACDYQESGAGVWDSYFSSLSSTLPAAEATGRLRIWTDSIVSEVLYDPVRGRASGVRVVDAATKEPRDLRARAVFLCASALPTTQILLNSTSDTFPNGLANSSGVLGHYLMDHTIGLAALAVVPGFDDMPRSDGRPTGVYIPRFRNLGDRSERFVRGYGYQGMGIRIGRRPRFFLAGFGECLPQASNRVQLSTERDAWGIPQVHVRFAWHENELAMRRDLVEQAVAMLGAMGAEEIVAGDAFGAGGEAIHEMGTARMGRDPRTSVLNAHNQAHDVPNVFVTDGACMTSSACQNPSLTYMALTARACAYAASALESGAL